MGHIYFLPGERNSPFVMKCTFGLTDTEGDARRADIIVRPGERSMNPAITRRDVLKVVSAGCLA